MQIEDDVDFFEIRSHGEGGLEWKYFASDHAVIFLDDLIERKLDDVRQYFIYLFIKDIDMV
jgi:hypothetical protein